MFLVVLRRGVDSGVLIFSFCFGCFIIEVSVNSDNVFFILFRGIVRYVFRNFDIRKRVLEKVVDCFGV